MGLAFTAMKMTMRTGREILVVRSIVCGRVGSLVCLGQGALSEATLLGGWLGGRVIEEQWEKAMTACQRWA